MYCMNLLDLVTRSILRKQRTTDTSQQQYSYLVISAINMTFKAHLALAAYRCAERRDMHTPKAIKV